MAALTVKLLHFAAFGSVMAKLNAASSFLPKQVRLTGHKSGNRNGHYDMRRKKIKLKC